MKQLLGITSSCPPAAKRSPIRVGNHTTALRQIGKSGIEPCRLERARCSWVVLWVGSPVDFYLFVQHASFSMFGRTPLPPRKRGHLGALFHGAWVRWTNPRFGIEPPALLDDSALLRIQPQGHGRPMAPIEHAVQ